MNFAERVFKDNSYLYTTPTITENYKFVRHKVNEQVPFKRYCYLIFMNTF